MFVPAVQSLSHRLLPLLRLIAALALAVDAIAAVADGAVHADLLARVVLALGSAHHRSCNPKTYLFNVDYIRTFVSTCFVPMEVNIK